MATRQYIGARYVAKFFTNENNTNEWVGNIPYEALEIVTYMNNSYTSKIPVPPTNVTPNLDTEHWVLTGAYNAQVEDYRKTTEEYKEQVNNYADKVSYLENYVTPQMFGAKGDGVNDDTQSFIEAIKTKKPIYIPKGEYLISEPFIFNAGERPVLIGENMNTSIIKYNGGENTYLFNFNGDYDNRTQTIFVLENLSAVGNNLNNGINMVYNTYFSRLNHVNLREFKTGIMSNNNWCLSFDSLDISSCSMGAKFITTNSSVFNGCTFSSCDIGLELETCRDVTLNSINVEACKEKGLFLNYSRGITINSLYAEQIDNTVIYLKACYAINISATNLVTLRDNTIGVLCDAVTSLNIDNLAIENSKKLNNCVAIKLTDTIGFVVNNLYAENINTGIEMTNGNDGVILVPILRTVEKSFSSNSSSNKCFIRCDFSLYASFFNKTYGDYNFDFYNVPEITNDASGFPYGYQRFYGGRPVWASGNVYKYADGTEFTK
nr:MAG TPA: tail spike protein [Caudoviricetes sp.]